MSYLQVSPTAMLQAENIVTEATPEKDCLSHGPSECPTFGKQSKTALELRPSWREATLPTFLLTVPPMANH